MLYRSHRPCLKSLQRLISGGTFTNDKILDGHTCRAYSATVSDLSGKQITPTKQRRDGLIKFRHIGLPLRYKSNSSSATSSSHDEAEVSRSTLKLSNKQLISAVDSMISRLQGKNEAFDVSAYRKILIQLSDVARTNSCSRSELLAAVLRLSTAQLSRTRFMDVLNLYTACSEAHVPLPPAQFNQVLTASLMRRETDLMSRVLMQIQDSCTQGSEFTIPKNWFVNFVEDISATPNYVALYGLREYLCAPNRLRQLSSGHIAAVILACGHVGDIDAVMKIANSQCNLDAEAEVSAALNKAVKFGLTHKGQKAGFFHHAGGVYNILCLLRDDYKVQNQKTWEKFVFRTLHASTLLLPVPRDSSHVVAFDVVPVSISSMVVDGIRSVPELKMSAKMVTRVLQMCYTDFENCTSRDALALLDILTPSNLYDESPTAHGKESSINTATSFVLRTLVDLAPAQHINKWLEACSNYGESAIPRSQKLHRDTTNAIQHAHPAITLEPLMTYTKTFLEHYASDVANHLRQAVDDQELNIATSPERKTGNMQLYSSSLRIYAERIKLVSRALLRHGYVEPQLQFLVDQALLTQSLLQSIQLSQESQDDKKSLHTLKDYDVITSAMQSIVLELLAAVAAHGQFCAGRGPFAHIRNVQSSVKRLAMLDSDFQSSSDSSSTVQASVNDEDLTISAQKAIHVLRTEYLANNLNLQPPGALGNMYNLSNIGELFVSVAFSAATLLPPESLSTKRFITNLTKVSIELFGDSELIPDLLFIIALSMKRNGNEVCAAKVCKQILKSDADVPLDSEQKFIVLVDLLQLVTGQPQTSVISRQLALDILKFDHENHENISSSRRSSARNDIKRVLEHFTSGLLKQGTSA